jgi:23S rRNA (adenine2503-C2)-methyltransferase
VADLPTISGLELDQLEAWLAERGQPAYRGGQLWAWLARGVLELEDMRDLPAGLRSELSAAFRTVSCEPVLRSDADAGLTTKQLYRLEGGQTVEAVVMRYPRRTTLCISSQVGCPIGCPFCATGQGPFGRNLTAAEIVDQALDANRLLASEGRRVSHVVFMGMGEPLLNLTAVLDAIRALTDPRRLGISPRRIVVSTSGIVPRIEELAQAGQPLTLAISLHAARDELRDELVPINRKYPLSRLIPAAQAYAERSGRRVSYEWVLLAGVNDSERDAAELGRLLRHRLAHVNLIPFNPVSGTPYAAPEARSIRRFAGRLRERGLAVTVRDTRGRESDAACGQLRARVLQDALALGPGRHRQEAAST